MCHRNRGKGALQLPFLNLFVTLRCISSYRLCEPAGHITPRHQTPLSPSPVPNLANKPSAAKLSPNALTLILGIPGAHRTCAPTHTREPRSARAAPAAPAHTPRYGNQRPVPANAAATESPPSYPGQEGTSAHEDAPDTVSAASWRIRLPTATGHCSSAGPEPLEEAASLRHFRGRS